MKIKNNLKIAEIENMMLDTDLYFEYYLKCKEMLSLQKSKSIKKELE